MENKIHITIKIFITAYLLLMGLLTPEHQIGFIIAAIVFFIISVIVFDDMNEINELLRIKLQNNCLEIIDKQEQEHINIPINKIKYCESIINANYIDTICPSLSFSHKFLVHTDSKKYEFEFPQKIRYSGAYSRHPKYINYDEIFELFDLNLPNYEYTFYGNIEHIKKDIEYYSIHHKRQNLIKRYYLYFLDLPFLSKLQNFLYIIALIGFLFINLVLIMLYLLPFLRDHGVFF